MTLPKGRVQRLPRLSIFPRLVRVRGPARPLTRMPCPSPPGCPKDRPLGKLGLPAHLPKVQPEVALPQLAHGPAQAGGARLAPAAAVAEFVALLEHGDGARATGSELFRAYATRRAAHGWPELKPNTFGMHLKACVEAVGGRKFKSCGQVYEGVCIPPAWREPLVQSA